MKYSVSVLAVFAAVVTSAPHLHRTNNYTNDNYHSDTSIYTDASICPCGTAFNGTHCNDLVCDTCDDPNFTCVDTAVGPNAEGSSSSDNHYLGKEKKACRLDNDASCHSCPTRSCQYQFGNFWGSGYPCLNLGITVGPGVVASFGADLSFTPMDENGNGNSVSIDAYGNSEVIDFCDSDEVHLSALSCGTDKAPVIVSPATCTHCQVARCIKWENADRYAAWNPQLNTTGDADFHKSGSPTKLDTVVIG